VENPLVKTFYKYSGGFEMDHIVRSAIARAQSEVKSKLGSGRASSKGRTGILAPKATKAEKAKRGSRSRKITHSDNDLIQLLEASQAKIMVVGCGGGGCNTIERMSEIGIHGASTFAINTDAQDLLSTKSDKKLLIGKKLTRGLGAGSDPSVGESAARESDEELKEVLKHCDLVFITCGLGGGTGTGSAPVVAELAKSLKALTVAVVTLPFTVEGKKRMENAILGLERLQEHTDTIIVIPNDKILEIAPDLPINAAFKVADEVLTNAVKGITEMVTKPGLINLDFADLRTILSRGGAAMIGLGESSRGESSEARALEAVENALTSPLLDVDISNANKALVNVTGGTDMTLREAEMIVETVSTKINSSSHIIWGAMVDETIPKNHIQAMVVIAGGRFPYLEKGAKDSDKIELDVEFA
jgi:cell division protein FtsZ